MAGGRDDCKKHLKTNSLMTRQGIAKAIDLLLSPFRRYFVLISKGEEEKVNT